VPIPAIGEGGLRLGKDSPVGDGSDDANPAGSDIET
jgi:hypothetical protein